MKRIKKLFLSTIFAICAFVVSGNVVNAAATVSNFNISCDSETIMKGGTATCYIGALLENDPTTGAGLHGMVVSFNNTHLAVESIESPFDGVKAEIVQNGQQVPAVSGLGNGQTYTCQANKPCYTFITTSTGAGKIQKGKSSITGIGSENYTVLGIVHVKLPADSKANIGDCGTVCIDPFYALTDASYSGTLNTSNISGRCAEIKVVDGQTETGNFLSYAVLAAGAFIAISAIALAKKHNKFYRV